MIIEKTAKNINEAKRQLFFFDSAREAFKQILNLKKKEHEYTLFLPGYIGFSPNEGSGIYDPVIETAVNHVFYPLDKMLSVDILALEKKLSEIKGNKIILLVHYFGYLDPAIDKIFSLCKKYGVQIIEDAAHALYTDFIDHRCGSYGDFVFYSLHKMLPFERGGLLKINSTISEHEFIATDNSKYSFWNYDLYAIANKRKQNAQTWRELLEDCCDEVEMLRQGQKDITPQTFPLIVKKDNRNELYFKLNAEGFGAVSLYHTMIKPIQCSNMCDAIWLSQHIINLPVHQDIQGEQIERMAKKIKEIIYE